MVCKVCDGVLVAGHVVIDAECIVICQGVADTDIGIARVVLVAVRAKEGKGDLRSFLCFGNLCIPDPVTQKIRSTVKIVNPNRS